MTRYLTTTAFALSLALAAAPRAAQADDVTDAMSAALAAYEEGDIQDALDELAYARQLITEMKTASLSAFLPQAPDGWTREIDTEMAAGMAMMGGGVGAEATYSGDGQSFSVTMMADNPMVAGFAGMLGSVGLLGGAKRVRIGGEKFMNQNGELVGLVGGRVLIQAKGAAPEVMVPILEGIDFDGLGSFGS